MALALCVAGLASADHMPNTLVVTITDSLDPAATLGSITYAVNVQNSGPNKVTNMVVVSTLPPGTQLLQCSPSCTVGNGTVTSTFSSVASNKSVKQSVMVKAPDTDTGIAISLTAQATATGAHTGDAIAIHQCGIGHGSRGSPPFAADDDRLLRTDSRRRPSSALTPRCS